MDNLEKCSVADCYGCNCGSSVTNRSQCVSEGGTCCRQRIATCLCSNPKLQCANTLCACFQLGEPLNPFNDLVYTQYEAVDDIPNYIIKYNENSPNNNISFSDLKIRKLKRQIIDKEIDNLKQFGYFKYHKGRVTETYNLLDTDNFTINPKPSESEKCKQLLQKFKNTKLSLPEKKNLYRNLHSSIENHNNLNLYLNLRSMIKKNKLCNHEIPTEYLDNIIRKQLSYGIDCILLYSQYTDEINNFNYSEAFNFGYSFLYTNLYILRYLIIVSCYQKVLDEFDCNSSVV